MGARDCSGHPLLRGPRHETPCYCCRGSDAVSNCRSCIPGKLRIASLRPSRRLASLRQRRPNGDRIHRAKALQHSASGRQTLPQTRRKIRSRADAAEVTLCRAPIPQKYLRDASASPRAKKSRGISSRCDNLPFTSELTFHQSAPHSLTCLAECAALLSVSRSGRGRMHDV